MLNVQACYDMPDHLNDEYYYEVKRYYELEIWVLLWIQVKCTGDRALSVTAIHKWKCIATNIQSVSASVAEFKYLVNTYLFLSLLCFDYTYVRRLVSFGEGTL